MSKHPNPRELLSPLHGADPAVIVYDPTYAQGPFVLLVNDVVVTAGPSAKALGKFAWANGAQSVRHAYDLGLDRP